MTLDSLPIDEEEIRIGPYKELTKEKQIQILLDDPYILDIYYTEKIEIPKINYNVWSEEKRDSQKKYVAFLGKYINLELSIKDLFKNNEDRGKWREIMEDKYYPWFCELISENALKFGNLVYAGGYATRLLVGYEGTDKGELEKKIITLNKNIPELEKYNMFDSDEKITIFKCIRNDVYNILSFLSEKKSFESLTSADTIEPYIIEEQIPPQASTHYN
jgi:hypothetical protein